jgi:hypothetical protein
MAAQGHGLICFLLSKYTLATHRHLPPPFLGVYYETRHGDKVKAILEDELKVAEIK